MFKYQKVLDSTKRPEGLIVLELLELTSEKNSNNSLIDNNYRLDNTRVFFQRLIPEVISIKKQSISRQRKNIEK